MAEVSPSEVSIREFDAPAALAGDRRMGDMTLHRFTLTAVASGDTLTFANHELAGVLEVAFRHVSGTLGTPAVSATALTFTGASGLAVVVYVWTRG